MSKELKFANTVEGPSIKIDDFPNLKEQQNKGAIKMSKELKFSSADEAMQHLANLTGKRIKISSLEITKIEDLTEWAKHNNKKLALQTVYGCERHRSQSQRSGWSEIDPEKLWDLLEKENEDLNKEECYISEGGAEEEFGHPLHLISFSVGIYGEKEWGQLDSLYLEGAKESGKVAIS